MNTATKPKNRTIHANTIEALRESAYEVTSEAIKKQTSATVDTLWNQLLGVKEPETPQKMSGDLTAGESIDFTKHKKADAVDTGKLVQKENKLSKTAAGIDYHNEMLHGEKRISKETEQMLSQQIQEISNELRQLVNSSQELAIQFKDVAVEQRVTKPGKYHISLFKFILTLVRQARMKVESSSACLGIAKGKKAKQGYWDLFAQQGTSFSMNNERSIATQAG